MANHISSHVPGEPGAFLINAYGMMYEEITASSLIKVDLARRRSSSKPDFGELDYGINKAGYVIHSAIHAARPEVACVIHTHSWASMAVSSLRVRPAAADADGDALPEDRLPRLPGRGARRTPSRPRCCADLGEREALILRNHGALVVGRTRRRGVQLDAPARARLPRADRRHGLQRAARGRCRPRCSKRPGTTTSRGTRRPYGADGVARAAAQARPAGPELSRLTRKHDRGDKTCSDAMFRRALRALVGPLRWRRRCARAGATTSPPSRCAWWWPSRPAAPPTSWRAPWPEARAKASSSRSSSTTSPAPAATSAPRWSSARRADGYTLIVNSVGPDGGQPDAVSRSSPYNPLTDLVPIVQIADVPNVLVVHPIAAGEDASRSSSPTPRRIPASSTTDRPASAPRRTCRASCSANAPASKTTHVPYKGADALSDLLAGRMQFMFATIPSVIGTSRRAGCARWRSAAPSDRARCRTCPTVAERGFPGFRSRFLVRLLRAEGHAGCRDRAS